KVFVSAEHVWYETFDGKKIPALLYRPRDIAPGEKLPAVVHVHGGPTGQWFRGFDPLAQFHVDRGLEVLEPNIRGSTGYCVEFADQMRTKLLMVHGVNDPRCPVSQSRIFRDKLIALGKREGEDFEYVELDDEGHGSADIQQKIRTFTILADYLERVL